MEGIGLIFKVFVSFKYLRRFFSFKVGTLILVFFPSTAFTSSIIVSNLASEPVLLAPLYPTNRTDGIRFPSFISFTDYEFLLRITAYD